MNKESNGSKDNFLYSTNAKYIENLYRQYKNRSLDIGDDWRNFFRRYENENFNIENNLVELAKFMIMTFRVYGHELSNLDPLNMEQNKSKEELSLSLESFGIREEHLDLEFDFNIELQTTNKKVENFYNYYCNLDGALTLRRLYEKLNLIYSGNIGVEFSHITNIEEKKWLYENLENLLTSKIDSDNQRKILGNLLEVESFESYLHKKFPGAKRFSIEGGESAILAFENIIDILIEEGAKNIVIGMSHRGRLSTLTKVMGKSYSALFSEFLGKSAFPSDLNVSGDVKYHMGYTSDKVINDKKIHLSLMPNPSHLEAINTPLAGKIRAKQFALRQENKSNKEGEEKRENIYNKICGILIHGDAAFCGQGVVSESFAMSMLDAFYVGGIIHIVINNQIGFTANAKDTRSSRYCTENAKSSNIPIIHVNSDNPEAVFSASLIAANYRQKFNKDFVLDVVCYRKYGHNEGDEPFYTQPLMYKIIKSKTSIANLYAEKLKEEDVINDEYYDNLKNKFHDILDNEFEKIENYKPVAQWKTGLWENIDHDSNKIEFHKIKSGVDKSKLKTLAKSLYSKIEDFNTHRKIEKIFENRLDNMLNNEIVDWSCAESLAFASLLIEGYHVRLTGQDSCRGTFSHRHSVLHDQENNRKYIPLNNLSKDQAYFEVFDSNLSEYGVLGFEYGYSLSDPNNLVIWEAQFGDFANGAQIIFDQFISGGEQKWLKMSGLTLLLPHGYEGQGPEHSSARLERFLQLASEDNMKITYPTTPASIFHLLRRQIKAPFRKPLIIMAPKSLLRHKSVISNLEELSENSYFIPIINETNNELTNNPLYISKAILCSGKIYYDLLEYREKNKISDTILIRIEELYPLNIKLLHKLLTPYKKLKQIIWSQEEPANMGAASYIMPILKEKLDIAKNITINSCSRAKSASVAAGYLTMHNREQEELIKNTFTIN